MYFYILYSPVDYVLSLDPIYFVHLLLEIPFETCDK